MWLPWTPSAPDTKSALYVSREVQRAWPKAARIHRWIRRSSGSWTISAWKNRRRRSLMYLGKVIGCVWSTVKHKDLEGQRMLLVQPLTPELTKTGRRIICTDSTGAGA